MKTSRLRAGTAVAAGVLALLSGCGGKSPSGHNVLLVTFDTTRADRFGVYGRPDARTPIVDRLARHGALVEWAIADVPVTLPSHTTIMTGVPALAHGARYNVDFRVTDDAETLAEEFADLGYDTGAVVSALALDSKFGIDQGFATFDDELTSGYVKYDESLYPRETHWLPKADRRAEETTDHLLARLGHAKRPFFLWTHYYDPHFPYDPPPPWERAASELYLAEIEYTDHQLGRIVRRLEETGEAESTVIVFAADHGEGLDDHREDEHGIFVYDDTVHVPLIVTGPGPWPAGEVIGDQVRTMDLASTILEAAGHPERTLGLGGTLVPLLSDTGPAPDSVAYCESIKTRLFYGGTGLKAVRTVDAKYIWAPEPELYRFATDPGERNNVAATDPGAAAMHRLLEDKVREYLGSGMTSVEAYAPDAETAEELRSLGYLSGSGANVTPMSFSEEMRLRGHDPKRLVDVSMAARKIQNGFYDEAERRLLRFFDLEPGPEEDPTMARLWAAAYQDYAKIWLVRGEYARAAEQYRLATLADPNYDLARYSRIHALNLAGKYEQADREARAILAEYPKSYRVMVYRGLALAFQGRTEEARAQLRQVADETDPRAIPSRNARYYLAKLGTPGESAALEEYLRSEKKGP